MAKAKTKRGKSGQKQSADLRGAGFGLPTRDAKSGRKLGATKAGSRKKNPTVSKGGIRNLTRSSNRVINAQNRRNYGELATNTAQKRRILGGGETG